MIMNDEPWLFDARPRVGRGVPVRFWVLTLGLTLVMTGIVGRSFYLQIIQGRSFLSTAEQNRVTALPIPAPRGVIYDRNGRALVENIATTDLVVDPAILPPEEHEAYLVDSLPQMVRGITPEQVRGALTTARSRQQPVVLKKALEHEEVLAIEAARENIFGVRLVSALARKYLFGQAFAHVVGHTGATSAEELENDVTLLPIDSIGKIGLEKQYDDVLRGKAGYTYLEVNASGRPQKNLGRQEPEGGKDLHITIDAEFQQYLTDLFREQATGGAVVALDPRDGAVLALVSSPTFDPNAFSQPDQGDAAAAIIAEPGEPLFQRSIQGAYPPGSTIKPFLAAAGLEEGVVTPETKIFSSGGIQVGVWNFPDWKAGGHGVTDVKKAIAESVNTFFYIVAGGDETHRGLGVETATRYLRQFNWGEVTGIDLPGEGAGFLPSKAWKEQTKGERWYIGDTYHLGIGQGDVLVTPLQLASATAALANQTAIIQPHVTQGGKARQKRLAFSRQTTATVREGMRQTITDGSGKRLAGFPVPLAGKTGTAQVGGEAETHAWFTSFGPYGAPEVVITVLLENAGEGDDVAVPFAEKIWRWWLEHRDVRSE